MKKIVCLVLALALVLTVGAALAEPSVSASYAEGVLYVTGSDIDTYYMVLVDGNDTGRSLSPKNPTVGISIKLEDGTHSIVIASDATGVSKSTSVKVGEDKPKPTEAPAIPTEAPVEPTEAPVEPTAVPEGPVKVSGVSYQNGVVSFSVSGLRGYGEIWLDGASSGRSVSANGSGSLSVRLKAGTHTLSVYLPTYDEISTVSFEVVMQQPTISASYQCGTLTITVSGINNPSEIWVDGSATPRSVSADGTYSFTYPLTKGTHTVLVYDATNNLKGTTTVTVENPDHVPEVVPGTAPTCTETGLTDGEACSVCGKVLKAQEVIPALGHTPKAVEAKEPTCTEKGLTEGSVCEVCGEVLTAQEEIPALGHNWKQVDKADNKIIFKCTRCGATKKENDPNYVAAKDNKNLYGSILKDLNNTFVDYTADGNGKILVITADLSKNPTSEIGMYLDADLIAQIQKEGYEAIEYINGEADITITLAEINPAWFETNSAIWCYVFSTDPAAAEGTLVKVEAQISGTEKVPATAFSGVTLNKGAESLAITANGNY